MLNRVLAAAVLAVTATFPLQAFAQSDWPSQPIHWIVPFPPGGQAEVAARIMGEHLSPLLGQPILVESKPGANGNIGAEEVANSKADGYTWLSSGVPLSTAPAMYPATLTIDPSADLVPVAQVGSTTFVMVVPKDVPVETLDEFIAYAKENDLAYAGSGRGSLVHLGSEMFKLTAGVDLRMIPYNGQPPAVTDVLANRVQFMIMGLALAQPLIESGDIKPLAVLNSERHPNIPDVPTIVEAGYPDLVMSGWMGIHVPAETPQDVIARIGEAVNEVLGSEEFQQQMQTAGWTPSAPHTQAEFQEFFDNEVAAWKKTVADAGVETN
jgi:tripartite-type tricarboxylate transporter receptor subunit TctC